MESFFEQMKYIQDHGGIMISVLVCLFIMGAVRTVDLFGINRRIAKIERRAVDRTAVHELYWHKEDMTPDEYKELKKRLGLE